MSKSFLTSNIIAYNLRNYPYNKSVGLPFSNLQDRPLTIFLLSIGLFLSKVRGDWITGI
ncbi:MAG TPA: hypothetical protein PLG41_13160 [Leptospiraceae bacterium]|nr:hypothetical protein [Leptospiraceae bacterium]